MNRKALFNKLIKLCNSERRKIRLKKTLHKLKLILGGTQEILEGKLDPIFTFIRKYSEQNY